jgi:hypothetical protein
MNFKSIINSLDESKKEFLSILDPNSIEAFYDKELPDISTDIIADLGDLKFVWDRHKSNENIEYHSFSHYLSRHFYNDKYRVVNGQKVGKDIVDISTDVGNEGLLCGYDINTNEDELPERALLLIRQEVLDKGRIRIISCYPTEKEQYIRWYFSASWTRKEYGTKRPDYVDRRDKMSEQALMELEDSRKMTDKVINDLIDEAVERSLLATEKFKQLIKERKINPVGR